MHHAWGVEVKFVVRSSLQRRATIDDVINEMWIFKPSAHAHHSRIQLEAYPFMVPNGRCKLSIDRNTFREPVDQYPASKTTLFFKSLHTHLLVNMSTNSIVGKG